MIKVINLTGDIKPTSIQDTEAFALNALRSIAVKQKKRIEDYKTDLEHTVTLEIINGNLSVTSTPFDQQVEDLIRKILLPTS